MLAGKLRAQGFKISHVTEAELLHQMGYSLQASAGMTSPGGRGAKTLKHPASLDLPREGPQAPGLDRPGAMTRPDTRSVVT